MSWQKSSNAWAAARDRRARPGIPRRQRAAQLPRARRRPLIGALRVAQAGSGAAAVAHPRSGSSTGALWLFPDLHPATQGGLAGEPQAGLSALPGGQVEPSAQAPPPQRQRGEPRTPACGLGAQRDVVDGLCLGCLIRWSAAAGVDGGRRVHPRGAGD